MHSLVGFCEYGIYVVCTEARCGDRFEHPDPDLPGAQTTAFDIEEVGRAKDNRNDGDSELNGGVKSPFLEWLQVLFLLVQASFWENPKIDFLLLHSLANVLQAGNGRLSVAAVEPDVACTIKYPSQEWRFFEFYLSCYDCVVRVHF